MKRILVIDRNEGFTSDIESELILNELENIDIATINSVDGIHNIIQEEQPDELVIAESVIHSHPDWMFQIPVKTYVRSSEGIQDSFDKGLESYGIVKTAKELISAISNNSIISHTTNSSPIENKENNEEVKPVTRMRKLTPSSLSYAKNDEDYKNPFNDTTQHSTQEKKCVEENNTHDPTPNIANKTFEETDLSAKRIDKSFSNLANDSHENNIASPSSKYRIPGDNMAHSYSRYKEKKKEYDANYEVEKDMGLTKSKAHVITVYSAKGGVGKTTLSCELATYLSLTSNGRNRYKVCIVDYNIDFGDVLHTLSFDSQKACMTVWAADIREFLNAGRKPHEIQYSEAEISKWLQYNEENGLYALLAPMTNEDSMDIGEQELQIMLDNLIYNGGFDFIVCDTGNNTRDSSFIALENADDIIMVMTQNINTANCNMGFLSTMHNTGFDMNKIKLVINKEQPYKSVGISSDELIDFFINPLTKKPYEILSIIRNFNDVKSAGNNGTPLVYKSSHPFTKGIGQIVSKIIGENFVLKKPEKKGFLTKLLKR